VGAVVAGAAGRSPDEEVVGAPGTAPPEDGMGANPDGAEPAGVLPPVSVEVAGVSFSFPDASVRGESVTFSTIARST